MDQHEPARQLLNKYNLTSLIHRKALLSHSHLVYRPPTVRADDGTRENNSLNRFFNLDVYFKSKSIQFDIGELSLFLPPYYPYPEYERY